MERRYVLTTRILLIVFLASVLSLPTHVVHAAPGDTSADAVLGQPDFTTAGLHPTSATSLNMPRGMAIDRNSGRLYVADLRNSRVLSWPNGHQFTNGQAADLVLGHPDFVSNQPRHGGNQLTNDSFGAPSSVAIDSKGSLYVADGRRVMRFDTPTVDQVADQVYTEANVPSLMSGRSNPQPWLAVDIAIGPGDKLYILDYNNSRAAMIPQPRVAQPEATTWYEPFIGNEEAEGLTVDSHGVVYIAAQKRAIVSAFTNTSPGRHLTADRVFGSPNSYAPGAGNLQPPTAKRLTNPLGLATDDEDNLYIVDTGNNRVLFFETPATGDFLPDAVFGQTDFTSNRYGSGADGFSAPYDVATDRYGNVYVADASSRILRYDTPPLYNQVRATGLRPATTAAGDGPLRLTVGGTNFTPETTVRWNGADLPTTFVRSDRLEARVSASLLAMPGQARLSLAQNGAEVPTTQSLTIYAAVAGDTTADHVFGQPDFSGESANSFGLDGASLMTPTGVMISSNGRLYVADRFNNRILMWNNATPGNGQPADFIIGQPDARSGEGPQVYNTGLGFPRAIAVDEQENVYVAVSYGRILGYRNPLATDTVPDLEIPGNGCTANTISAAILCSPEGLTVDKQGNLYVADRSNHRVLIYRTPLSTDGVADVVLGQPNFGTNAVTSLIDATTLKNPGGLAVDAAGNLFVAESLGLALSPQQNPVTRVLEFDSPLTTDAVADRVYGQPDMNTGTSNTGGVSAQSLGSADAIDLDQHGNLFIADGTNRRVLAYRSPLTSDNVADVVFGQPDFATASEQPASRTAMPCPVSLATSPDGDLFVGDFCANRILAFDSPLGGSTAPSPTAMLSATPRPTATPMPTAIPQPPKLINTYFPVARW